MTLDMVTPGEAERRPFGGPSAKALGDASLEREVDQERVAFLYRKAPVALLTVIVNSALVAWLLEPLVSGTLLSAWLAGVGILTVGRAGMLRWYRAHTSQYSSRFWERIFVLGSGLNGVLWGLGVLTFFNPEVMMTVVIVFLIGGMIAGASSSTSTSMVAFWAYSGLSGGPIFVRLLMESNRFHGVMAAMLGMFIIAMGLLARQGGEALISSTRLRLENEHLMQELRRRSQERSNRFRLLLEQAGIVTIVADPTSFQIIDLSGNAEALFEAPLEVLQAMRLPELEPFPSLGTEQAWQRMIPAALTNEVILGGRRHLGGREVVLEMSLMVQRLDEADYALVVFRDVTERRAREALHAQAS